MPYSIPAIVNVVPQHAAWYRERFLGLHITSMFQPVFNAYSGKVFGYEALARASDDNRRAIPTGDLIAQLRGEQVFDADLLFRKLHLQNFKLVDDSDSVIMINLSPSTAISELLGTSSLASVISQCNLPPGRVCIEILEHDSSDESMLMDAVQAYRQLGCLIAIDDFGIGASKFERVDKLKPDIVKIDRHLLMDAVSNTDARQVLPWLIELLHRQGAKVLIEGIEEIGEALVALESGADFLQGFYLAYPRPGLIIDPLTERILSELIRMSNNESELEAQFMRSYHADHPKNSLHRSQWDDLNPHNDNRRAILDLMRDFLSAPSKDVNSDVANADAYKTFSNASLSRINLAMPAEETGD